MLLKLALPMQTVTLYRETSENINHKIKHDLFARNFVSITSCIKMLLGEL